MYVYFIKAVTGHETIMIKIGYAKSPKTRLRLLQVGSPVRLTLMGAVKCNSESHARKVENDAHEIFDKQRRRGEWFRLTKQQLGHVKSFIHSYGTDLNPNLSLEKQADMWLKKHNFDCNGRKVHF